MAPDVNSLPPSPYRDMTTTPRRPSQSRRLSERMASPSNPLYTSTTPPRSPTSASASLSQPPPREDNTGVDPGPGPLRHPRPLTAADLHMQLEKEQEAVVNRLTRELTFLRQQTASVTSTTSSTSASTGITDSAVQTESGVLLGSSASGSGSNVIHPTSSRRHRSSSNLSSRGTSVNSTAATAGSTVNTPTGLAGSGIAPPRDSSYSHNRTGGDPLSRQSSVASRRSDASSPSLPNTLLHVGADQHPFPASSHQRHSHSNSISTPGGHGVARGGGSGGGHVPSTSRYDDAAQARAELDMIKAENEALKGRIRELERMVRRASVSSAAEKSESDAGRGDSHGPGLPGEGATESRGRAATQSDEDRL